MTACQNGVHLRVQKVQSDLRDVGRSGRGLGQQLVADLLQARPHRGQTGEGRDQPQKEDGRGAGLLHRRLQNQPRLQRCKGKKSLSKKAVVDF